MSKTQETFSLKLIRPTSEKKVDINWISLETPAGNIVIKKGHTPLLAKLEPHKELTFETETKVTESMTLPGGIVDVQRDSVTIIVDA